MQLPSPSNHFVRKYVTQICGVQHVFSERLLWQLRYLRFEFSGRSSSCNAGLRDDVNLLGVINTGGPAVSQ